MPLRDHFHPPLAGRRRWDAFHGSWPCLILMGLDRRLPQRYVAEPRIHLGSSLESDVPTFDEDDAGFPTPPRPTLAVATDLPDMDAYEVRVYDTIYGRQLVAAVEVVSPSNKDRPEHRRAFVAKCATLLRDSVSVTIVDLVTTHNFNLYADLIEFIGQTDPSLGDEAPGIYAVACRWGKRDMRPAGDLDESPGGRPAVADPAALDRRQLVDTAGAGTELRGDLPHPPHPVDPQC